MSAVINAVIAGAPAGMTIGLHVCRSQDPSWQADAGYDAIAEPLFNDINVGIYFLEYDNARAGDLSPLRLVPPGKFVVLGLVATKVTEVETADRAQAAHRGGQPLHQARAARSEPAMRLLDQRRRACRGDGRDRESQARPRGRSRARRVGRLKSGTLSRICRAASAKEEHGGNDDERIRNSVQAGADEPPAAGRLRPAAGLRQDDRREGRVRRRCATA